jgi:hypothetical protein
MYQKLLMKQDSYTSINSTIYPTFIVIFINWFYTNKVRLQHLILFTKQKYYYIHVTLIF